MLRLADLDKYLILVVFDIAALLFWWKLMALLGDRRMLPSPEAMIANSSKSNGEFFADEAAESAGYGGQDGTWKKFPTIVKVTLIMALVVSAGILIEGALLMPWGVAVWGWQKP